MENKVIKVVTGNKNKQEEISQYIKAEFIDLDLKEIDGNYVDIILYKLKEALNHIKLEPKEILMVEDVTLFVNDKFYPDIKWKQDELKEFDKVKMILSIGKYQNGKIEVYTKKLEGEIHFGLCNEFEFGFDNILMIGKYALGEYKKLKPIRNLFKEIIDDKIQPEYSIEIDKIEPWVGKYQNA